MELFIAICALIAFALIGIGSAMKLVEDTRSRATRPELYRWADCDYRTDPPEVLDYKYIDWLERELKVGEHDPEVIEQKRQARLKAEAEEWERQQVEFQRQRELRLEFAKRRAEQHQEQTQSFMESHNVSYTEARQMTDDLLGFDAEGDRVVRPVRRDVNKETGEWSEIRAFGS